MSLRGRGSADRSDHQRLHLLLLLKLVPDGLKLAQVLVRHQLCLQVLVKTPDLLGNLLPMNRLKLVVANLRVQLASGCESTANDLDLATSLLRSALRRDSEQVSGLLELKRETLAIVIDSVC